MNEKFVNWVADTHNLTVDNAISQLKNAYEELFNNVYRAFEVDQKIKHIGYLRKGGSMSAGMGMKKESMKGGSKMKSSNMYEKGSSMDMMKSGKKMKRKKKGMKNSASMAKNGMSMDMMKEKMKKKKMKKGSSMSRSMACGSYAKAKKMMKNGGMI